MGGLADDMKKESDELAAAVKAGNPKAVYKAANDLNTSCNDCHRNSATIRTVFAEQANERASRGSRQPAAARVGAPPRVAANRPPPSVSCLERRFVGLA